MVYSDKLETYISKKTNIRSNRIFSDCVQGKLMNIYIKMMVYYEDPELQNKKIYKENNGKTGIYM